MSDHSYDSESESASKLLNIEKQMTNEVKKRRVQLEAIGNLNASVQSQAQAHLKNAGDLANTVKKLEVEHINKIKALGAVENNEERDKLERAILSHKVRIDMATYEHKHSMRLFEDEYAKLIQIQEQHLFWFKTLSGILGVETKIFGEFKKISDEMKKAFPDLSSWKTDAISSIIVVANFARKMYDGFEKSAFEFRKFSGMTREGSKSIRIMSERIAIDLTNIGVKLDDVYTSVKVLGNEMGGFRNVTKDLIITTSVLKSQLGVSEENTAGMLRNLAAISNTTMASQQNMAYFAHGISQAAGVPLNIVMGDVAKMSGVALSMISKSPTAIIKTAVEARRLGTELNKMADASSKLLDFQNSVNAEMEASVLIGQSINLQEARRKAYQGDLVGSTEEILKLSKSVNFEKLDYFQMQSFAKATGRSVEELTKMLQAQKQMDEARASGDPEVQRQLKAYEEMKAANEATAKSMGGNLGLMLLQKANQERTVVLQNQWNKMLMQASEMFLPIIDFSLKVVGALMSVLPIMSAIGRMIVGIGTGMLRIGDGIAVIYRTTNAWISMGNKFANFGIGILKTFGILGKWVPILGQIIWGFQLISSLWKNFLNPDISNWKAFCNVLYEMLVKPFKDALDWITSIFVGRSPSELALGIVRGIVSVQGMLFDALTYPFRKAWAWISGSPSPSLVVPTSQSAPSTLADNKTNSVADESKSSSGTTNAIFTNILDAINTLNANLTSGKVAVYIDGSLMSSTLARNISFKGNFGTNT